MEGKPTKDFTIGQQESGVQQNEAPSQSESMLMSHLKKSETIAQNFLDELGLNIKAVGEIAEYNNLEKMGNPQKRLSIRLEKNGNPMTDMFFDIGEYRSNDDLKKDLHDRLLASGELDVRQKKDVSHEQGMAGE